MAFDFRKEVLKQVFDISESVLDLMCFEELSEEIKFGFTTTTLNDQVKTTGGSGTVPSI